MAVETLLGLGSLKVVLRRALIVSGVGPFVCRARTVLAGDRVRP